MKKYKILVTNDDGINAPGIRFLIDIAKEFGEVNVMAPDKGQSATSHSITFADPLRIKTIEETDSYKEYSCNGTPVDCIKLAENVKLTELPDLVVSGINHGSNASINVIYSGTMAAVIEACIDEIPAIGFSYDSYSSQLDFEPARPFMKTIIKGILENGMPKDVCLNVNIPNTKELKGIKVCRQAKASWKEGFDTRTDPRGGDYHWLTGHFEVEDNSEGTDLHAIENGYLSVVPVQVDLTAHKAINDLKFLETEL
ncbi:5'/3'-nucleotidase SurE [Lentimicrobium sp. S6]|uniref:5'/3'-nucleotidase SurE n=1 Tax=Lentimicrobium sp. S6 TaxID=2735872 RepID=UPI001556EC58|nr:5'/3'-nucleotidase SurE [Lentimicrobium sp. S6]NPD44292.1 5'/3'-nucleotidase SurE [Lentimicrobium sp. S6]